MRRDAFLWIAALLGGCGYVGNPLPPAVNIPLPVKDVRAAQVGDRIILEFTPPVQTTESLVIKRLGAVDVRVGQAEKPFAVDAWAAKAKAVDAKLSDTGAVRMELPVRDWVGQDVVIGVRTANVKGRASAWSNFAMLHIAAPPLAPTGLKAESDAKGARLSWTGASPSYRVLRKLPGDKEGIQIGEPTEAMFLDETAEFDKRYVYSVVAVDGGAKSLESVPLEFTAEDKFAPATPAGLTAIIGPASVELAWESNTESDLRGYRVYRSIGAGEWQRLSDLVEVPTFSDKKLQAGQKHGYRVTAFDKHGNESERSLVVAVDVP